MNRNPQRRPCLHVKQVRACYNNGPATKESRRAAGSVPVPSCAAPCQAVNANFAVRANSRLSRTYKSPIDYNLNLCLIKVRGGPDAIFRLLKRARKLPPRRRRPPQQFLPSSRASHTIEFFFEAVKKKPCCNFQWWHARLSGPGRIIKPKQQVWVIGFCRNLP